PRLGAACRRHGQACAQHLHRCGRRDRPAPRAARAERPEDDRRPSRRRSRLPREASAALGGPMNARNDRYWNRATQTAPREVLDQLHLARIRHLVALAYERSPLHRRLYDDAGIKPDDIRTWDDYYYRLPFTDKPHYMTDQEAHGYGGLALDQHHWQQYFHTTGTTGRFLNEVFTQYEMHKAGSQYCYGLWDYGIRPTD